MALLFNKQSPIEHLSDFKRVLGKYKPSQHARDVVADGPLVLLVAPAAAGRNTIIRNLIMTGKYYFVVSDTTRPPRMNNGVLERSGNEYWFRKEEEMLDDLKRGQYVGQAIIHNQQVSAINVREVTQAQAQDKIPITDIEIKGCDEIIDIKADAHCVFVLPPSFNEWMRRMDGRGAMDPREKRRRLESAIHELTTSLSKDYYEYVINWDLRVTCERIHQLVVNNKFIDQTEQIQAEHHARQLLTDIHEWKKNN